MISKSTNIWDNGYSSGGNYWSDYKGKDGNGDGIGDTPYSIDQNNVDRYPLMNIRGTHDVAVTSLIPSKTVIGQGSSATITLTVQNKDSLNQIFKIHVLANTTIIRTVTTYLESGQTKTITVQWTTTGWAKGKYEINCLADRVPGETDQQAKDNKFTDGLVTVAMPGDINADSIVDIFDLVRVALTFGSTPKDPIWDPNADLTDDQLIDIYDLVGVSLHFGKKTVSHFSYRF